MKTSRGYSEFSEFSGHFYSLESDDSRTGLVCSSHWQKSSHANKNTVLNSISSRLPMKAAILLSNFVKSL